jgi:hypothetical protein
MDGAVEPQAAGYVSMPIFGRYTWFRKTLMATPWEDSVRKRSPRQLVIFVTPTLSKPWRRAFDDALKTFNELSRRNRLGLTMVAPDNAIAWLFLPDALSQSGRWKFTNSLFGFPNSLFSQR